MTRYIAIDGKGGSGKTYLSGALAKALDAPLLHLDKYGSDFAPFVGIPALVEMIKDTNGDTVIYEGVGVFSEEFDQFESFKIFVDTPPKLRISRLRKRDIPRADRSIKDWLLIGKIWNRAERKYFTKSVAQKADLIVGAKDGDFDVASILTLLQKSK